MNQEDLLGKGDLESVAKREDKFPWLVDDGDNWTVRNDVYYQDARINFKGSPLSPTSNGKTIGPELGFGHVMGTFHDEQVLLIKTAMGNRALGWDFRPPSSGRTDKPDADRTKQVTKRPTSMPSKQAGRRGCRPSASSTASWRRCPIRALRHSAAAARNRRRFGKRKFS